MYGVFIWHALQQPARGEAPWRAKCRLLRKRLCQRRRCLVFRAAQYQAVESARTAVEGSGGAKRVGQFVLSTTYSADRGTPHIMRDVRCQVCKVAKYDVHVRFSPSGCLLYLAVHAVTRPHCFVCSSLRPSAAMLSSSADVFRDGPTRERRSGAQEKERLLHFQMV